MRWNQINERANPSPAKFWLVFNLTGRDEDTARQVGEGKMPGVKGISASRVIVSDFLSTSGNACLVMDRDAVLGLNDIDMVDYRRPTYLCQNDLEALYRLWSKSRDKFGRIGVMQNLVQYALASMKQDHAYKHRDLEYYGAPSNVAYDYSDHPVIIETPDELARYVHRSFERMANEKHFTLQTEFEDTRQGVYGALERVATYYESESEWLVRSPEFNIPQGSSLLLLTSKEVMETYDDWKSGSLAIPSWRKWEYERLDKTYTAIRDHGLDQRYRIRMIDEMHFAKVNAQTMAKRRAKTSGA